MVIGETRITGANGKSAYGEFILLPRRAEELKAMPQADALEEIRLAVKLGQERGARIVGLGAYTSVVCQGGYLLKGDGMPALTTGNSFTAAAARQAVRLAAAERGWNLSDCTVAVIGAGGSVGQALSILLSTEARSLILLGNPAHPDASRQRLKQVVGRIAHATSEMPWRAQAGSVAEGIAGLALDAISKSQENGSQENGMARLAEELIQSGRYLRTSVDAARMMREADIVVSCTNTTERMIRPECLRPSAVVCDVARPSNVSEQVASRRRDVMVIDGAVVRLPDGSPLGFNTSLAHGHAYACMAETMMLAMEHRYTDLSLGFDLPLGPVLELESLAEKHGFEVVAHRGAQSTAVEAEEDLQARAQLASV
jgi:predicted amino acid dehydrogenase